MSVISKGKRRSGRFPDHRNVALTEDFGEALDKAAERYNVSAGRLLREFAEKGAPLVLDTYRKAERKKGRKATGN